ncbi:MAG: hypothetical protein IJS59_10020 [Bacteroidaceae bacterium]|nr:hypothetical protein [Bacteroidaceae bacterium]
MDRHQLRNTLNTIFMLTALVGVVTYFAFPAHHVVGIIIVGVAMVVKVVEFFIRFMF